MAFLQSNLIEETSPNPDAFICLLFRTSNQDALAEMTKYHLSSNKIRI